MAASETDHLECRRLAFRECNRETLTLREGVRIKQWGDGNCARNETLSDMNYTLCMFWQFYTLENKSELFTCNTAVVTTLG